MGWGNDGVAVVVGCKHDLVDGSGSDPSKRQVSENEGIGLARKLKAHVWAEVSSKSAHGGMRYLSPSDVRSQG